ncbi:hypothetical protein EW146_g9064, partial [Bondarzewia mesenterica]
LAAARQFITEKSISDDVSALVKAHCGGTGFWKGLLLLRGLLADGIGILVYVLKERRWRVDYGLDPSRSLLAVPYRAKDVPSLRAEFGHPDVAISLTCLSYYYGGLTKDQLLQCFEALFKLDNPAHEYDQWIRRSEEIPPEFCQLIGVNIEDHKQVESAKEFPHKLATSGWDLAEKKDHTTTGFSGTNDNRYLLPTSIAQRDPVQQLRTNALVLMYLLQPENNHYICTQGTNDEPCSTAKFLSLLEQQDSDIRVLLDVGAQMLDMENEELVRCWLSLKEDVSAAIFFSEKYDLSVLTRDGIVEPFFSSPYNQQLEKCVVYLDDAHTRGTDLQLPRHTRAAVTLGPKVTKDRLLQGCMRMRKLGNGQSVMFCAPLEVDRRIRAAAGLGPVDQVNTLDILRWVMLETCADIERHAPHWAQQGLDYDRRRGAYLDHSGSSEGDVEILKRGWLQPEARTLEEMYAPSFSSGSSPEYHEALEVPALRERLDLLGVKVLSDTKTEEEQEREVSHEIERENQVERPPKAIPASHNLHVDVRNFVRTGDVPHGSSQFLSLFRPLRASQAWSRSLLATADFMTTITPIASFSLTDYLRPVNWILSSSRRGAIVLVAISPFEANALLPEIRKSQAVHLHIYTPRVIQAMKSFSDLQFYSIPPLPSSGWAPPPRLLQSQLNLWAGQLYLDNYQTYIEICAFLGLYTKLSLDSSGAGQSRIQSDGFIKPEDRPVGGQMQAVCHFDESPVVALKTLIGLRRKYMSYLTTHLGKILHARLLTEEDFVAPDCQVDVYGLRNAADCLFTPEGSYAAQRPPRLNSSRYSVVNGGDIQLWVEEPHGDGSLSIVTEPIDQGLRVGTQITSFEAAAASWSCSVGGPGMGVDASGLWSTFSYDKARARDDMTKSPQATPDRLRSLKQIFDNLRMMILGGYHISIPATRALDRVLGIPNADFEDHRMHWAINDWLVDRERFDILPRCHVWLDTSRGIPCIFFFTQFHEWCPDLQLPLKERPEDLRVKEWLEKNDVTGAE